MNWLFRLFKQAAFANDLSISFGIANTNNLKGLINQLLSDPPQESSKMYWFNALQNDPGTNLI
ncbi:MAG: hypothetical protein ACTSUK_08420, partial [Promethearchaeota archaeon]